MLPTRPRNKIGTSELDSFRSSIAQPVVTPGERFKLYHSWSVRLAKPYAAKDFHLLSALQGASGRTQPPNRSQKI